MGTMERGERPWRCPYGGLCATRRAARYIPEPRCMPRLPVRSLSGASGRVGTRGALLFSSPSPPLTPPPKKKKGEPCPLAAAAPRQVRAPWLDDAGGGYKRADVAIGEGKIKKRRRGGHRAKAKVCKWGTEPIVGQWQLREGRGRRGITGSYFGIRAQQRSKTSVVTRRQRGIGRTVKRPPKLCTKIRNNIEENVQNPFKVAQGKIFGIVLPLQGSLPMFT